MDIFFDQVFSLLTTPPGNLVYRVILAFSVAGALQMSARHWRETENRPVRRMALVLEGLLLLQLLLFIAAGLGWQGLVDAHKLLPVMVWGASLLSILWMIWLWAFPEPSRFVDAATTLLTLLILSLTVLGVLWWDGQSPLLYFNGSIADQSAGIIGMGLCLLGFLLITVRQPAMWTVGSASMIVLFAACLLHWFYPTPESDYAGILRLAEMVVYPLLLMLPNRALGMVKEAEKQPTVPVEKEARMHKEADPKLLQIYLSLATETDPKSFYHGIAKAFAQLMVADMCLLVHPPNNNDEIMVPVGYDLIMDRVVEGFSLDAHNLPLLTNVLRRGRNLRLPARSNSLDLSSLANALGVKQAGHLLAVAVTPKGGVPLLSIVLLSPYSNRIWSAEDQQTLIDCSLPLAGILQRAEQDAQRLQALEKARSDAETAQAHAAQAQQELASAQAERDTLLAQVEQEQTRAAAFANQVAELELALEEAKDSSTQPAQPDTEEHLQSELDMALAEIVRLKTELTRGAGRRSRVAGGKLTPDQAEAKVGAMATIAQELRRPISTINEHTNNMLTGADSVMEAGQRKSLERIKTAVERLSSLLDEIIDVAAVDNRVANLHPAAVDLNRIIDGALPVLIGRLGERNIALRVDLPEVIPPLYADREALTVILTSLMKNAGTVTPVDGEIWLRARIDVKENEPGFLLLQVTDSGEGVPPESLAQVFSNDAREAAQQNQQGVVDDGSLAQVKLLVDAHGGRIWVDSELGKGTTFSVLMPLLDDYRGQSGGLGI